MYSKLPTLVVTFMPDRTRQEKVEVKRSQSGSPESVLDVGATGIFFWSRSFWYEKLRKELSGFCLLNHLMGGKVNHLIGPGELLFFLDDAEPLLRMDDIFT